MDQGIGQPIQRRKQDTDAGTATDEADVDVATNCRHHTVTVTASCSPQSLKRGWHVALT